MDLINKTLSRRVCFDKFTKADVLAVLRKERLSAEDYAALLSPAAEECLEQIACRSFSETRKQFGNSVSLFTPLYISNYCENYCTYCGFNCRNKIKRAKLTAEEIESELNAISETGLQEILLLTGESRSQSGVQYIGEAVKLAAKYFTTVGIEIYPLDVEEYAYIYSCGADFVSIYQETYNKERYAEVHIKGKKSDFEYRFNSQERAVQGGMRGVSFGCLLGLSDFRSDAFYTGIHAYELQRKYPHADISFSVPRLRTFIGGGDSKPCVSEKQLLQVMMAYRIFMPFAGITISTRERAGFRDRVVGLAANKISAGVKVGIGGHSDEQKGDEQFDISDDRDVKAVHDMLKKNGLQPVYTDHITMT